EPKDLVGLELLLGTAARRIALDDNQGSGRRSALPRLPNRREMATLLDRGDGLANRLVFTKGRHSARRSTKSRSRRPPVKRQSTKTESQQAQRPNEEAQFNPAAFAESARG